MCEALKDAIERVNSNTAALADQINDLPIPCAFKGVFMQLAGDRGFKVSRDTFSMMQIIGESESEVCLMVLEGNSKRAGLIVAYRLATELDNDKDRAAAVEWVREKKPNGVLDEKTILLAILSVRG